MRVFKTGMTIISRDHLGIPLYVRALSFLVYPSSYGSDEQVYQKRPREEEKPERKRKSEGMWIQERLSRIVDRGLAVPPSMPMVF